MRVFIAGAYSRYFVFDWLVRERERERMRIYLAGAQSGGNIPREERYKVLRMASEWEDSEALFGRGRPVA